MPNTELIQSLAIVVGFLVVVFFISTYLKRTIANRKISTLGIDFKIISKLPLSNKSFLYIIKIGNHFLLIGTSDNNISAIADLTKVFQANEIRSSGSSNINISNNLTASQVNTNDISFKNFLKETFRKSKN